MYEPTFVHTRPKIIFALVGINVFTVINALQIRMTFHLHITSQNSCQNLENFHLPTLNKGLVYELRENL